MSSKFTIYLNRLPLDVPFIFPQCTLFTNNRFSRALGFLYIPSYLSKLDTPVKTSPSSFIELRAELEISPGDDAARHGGIGTCIIMLQLRLCQRARKYIGGTRTPSDTSSKLRRKRIPKRRHFECKSKNIIDNSSTSRHFQYCHLYSSDIQKFIKNYD